MLRRALLATVQNVSSTTVCSRCALNSIRSPLRLQQQTFSQSSIIEQATIVRGSRDGKPIAASRGTTKASLSRSSLSAQQRDELPISVGDETKLPNGLSATKPIPARRNSANIPANDSRLNARSNAIELDGTSPKDRTAAKDTPIVKSNEEARRAVGKTEEGWTRESERPRRKDTQDEWNTPLPPDASATLSKQASSAPPRSFRRLISTYLALTKPRLAFLIVLTTTAAYSIYPIPALLSTTATAAPSLSTLTLAFLTTGTFMTVASANTLNMLFEPQHDAKMSRTRNRPLVRRLLSKRAAFLFALTTGVFGFGTLWIGVNPTTALLGAGNLVLYAFIYTPFKRIHPVNTWIGAIVGAIPPLMGWVAAASQYSTRTTTGYGNIEAVMQESRDLLFTEQAVGGWLLAALLFAWQFPHFFALSHAVRNEYASAGYKMLTSKNIPMAARVSLRYSLLMFPICYAMTAYGVTNSAFVYTSSIINAWMLKEAWRFWRLNGEKGSARALFWASVWQLPIVLVMAMMLKRGLWERIMNGIFGISEAEDDDFEVER